MSHDPPDLPEFRGTQRYEPVRLLGMGGMGAVYEAIDRTTGGRVALKVMLADDPVRLLRFKQEFRVMAELHHPNLVRLFDLGQHEGRWFFTMELVHGQDLLEVLHHDVAGLAYEGTTVAAPLEATVLVPGPGPARGGASGTITERTPLRPVACDPDALIRVVAQILDALGFLHDHGIVHRDLKPSNILVDLEGTVRVLDFGLASRLDREAAISQEGVVVGTLAYLSPEQYRGEPASAASDLYALGCLMFHLLAGELPFRGTPFQALVGRVQRPPPRLDERVTGVPEELAEVVRWLMARDPAERPTIPELRAALGIGAPRASAPPAPRSARGEATVDVFVGRARELSILAGCLERAAGGQAQIALVSGPSGIGKSALAAMATRRAERLGFFCFHGRCHEREQVPFVAFDRVMDALTLALRGWPAPHLAALRPHLLVLERIFPGLGLLLSDRGAGPAAGRFGGAPPAGVAASSRAGVAASSRAGVAASSRAVGAGSDVGVGSDASVGSEVSVGSDASAGGGAVALVDASADPRELRRQAVDGFARLVAYFQGQSPLCLVLDDLQWADEESVELLSALLASGAGRVMVIALYRPDALLPDHPLVRLLRALEGSGRATDLPLARLSEGDAAHLVEAVTGGRIARATSAALAAQADGSPFLVRRLAEHLCTVAPAEQSARLEDVGSTDSLLRTMIATLSPRAERALAILATAGGDLPVAVLRATSGLAGEDLDLALGELYSARFAKAVPPKGAAADAPPDLDVYHARIRDAAYQALPEERRRALHRSLAAALEAEPDGARRHAEALVRHFDGAGDRARRRRAAIEAARQAEAKLAFVHAARHLALALEDPELGEDPLAVASRWERAGDLFEHGGHHLEAGRAYQEARARWDASPDRPERHVARVRLRGLAGANLVAGDRIAEGRAEIAEGLALLGLPLERPRPRRIAELIRLRVQTEVAERTEGLRAATGIGGAHVPSARDSAAVRFLDHAVRALQALWPLPAAEAAMRSELLGRRADDRRVLVRSLAFGAAVPVFLDRCTSEQLRRAHRRLDDADQLAREHGLVAEREMVQLNRSVVWLATSAERARRTCEAAIAGLSKRGLEDSYDGRVARGYLLIVLATKGDDDDALAAAAREIDGARPNIVNVSTARFVQIQILARRGLVAEAEAALHRLRSLLAGLPASRLDSLLATAAAHVALARGRFAEVLAAAPQWERAARVAGVEGMGLDRTKWLEVELQAAVLALREGALSPEGRRRARAQASWLSVHGVLDLGCLGDRALAYLERADGRRTASREVLRRALWTSSAATSPYPRWLCLEAARDLGVITLEQESEAEDLRAHGRFVQPRDRASSS